MPIYVYCCENGCEEEHTRSWADRDQEVLCEAHNLSMQYVPRIGNIPVRKGSGLYSIDTPSKEKPKDLK